MRQTVDLEVRRITIESPPRSFRRFEGRCVDMENLMPPARKLTAQLRLECVARMVVREDSHSLGPNATIGGSPPQLVITWSQIHR
jgi:hypothetical protein